MNAEQWLNDLEAKAAKALFILEHQPTDDPSSPVDYSDIDACEMQAFFDAATPAAVNRLVAMVKMMSLGASEYCPRPVTACRSDSDCSLCWLEASYQQTEPKP